MKKVLLTKSQHKFVKTTDVIKKPQNLATTSPTMNVRVMHMHSDVITDTYMQRKSFQSIYEEIFKLLMRLPDKALQQRVIDAINGRNDKSTILNPNQCKQCSINEQQKSVSLKVNASTQTETLETKETNSTKPNSDECVKEKQPVKSVNDENNTPKTESTTPAKVPRKRGRKRNTCVPQVVKRSAAQMALQEREEKQLTPLAVPKKKKMETVVPTRAESPAKNQRRDSFLSNLSLDLNDINLMDIANDFDAYINNGIQHVIYSTMANEYRKADIQSDEGLLPIHDAILVSDVHGVQRQVYVWSKLKGNVDFNELVSADGEDCLELALTNDCDAKIVKIILTAGVLPNHIYEDSNTALHIAIINNVQLESLRELMLRIDLNLLLKTNDDGYTALHIAVRHNRYKMAEIICDTIDQRELGESVYKRISDEKEETSQDNNSKVTDTKDEKLFAKFYEHACDRLDNNKDKLLRRRLKHEILNASEARAGNVSLFYAIEGELEHFCYFLLAHLTNPDEENMSGHSPKSYHYEFARALRINLKISRIMDKVIGILNGTSK